MDYKEIHKSGTYRVMQMDDRMVVEWYGSRPIEGFNAQVNVNGVETDAIVRKSSPKWMFVDIVDTMDEAMSRIHKGCRPSGC